jgi:hypothetical protein
MVGARQYSGSLQGGFSYPFATVDEGVVGHLTSTRTHVHVHTAPLAATHLPCPDDSPAPFPQPCSPLEKWRGGLGCKVASARASCSRSS